MEIITPDRDFTIHHDSTRVPLEFLESPQELSSIDGLKFRVPIFKTSEYFVLIKDLADVWNYPSSYQLISQLIKQSPITKQDITKTDKKLNEQLGNLVNPQQYHFIIKLSTIYGVLKDKSVLTYTNETPESYVEVKNPDKITVSQIFPQYGFIDSTLELKHSTFNTLTNLSKYNYYKSIGEFKNAPLTKMYEPELEMFYSLNDHAKIEANENVINEQVKKRKGLSKNKKSSTTDPNSLDLTENVIPGQGFFQEFNVNSICRVPNYYVTNNQQQQQIQTQQQTNLQNSNVTLNSSFLNLPKKEAKVSRNVQQLVFNNEYDHFNFGRYFYTMTYRGLGSGNYKDASVMNRINRIPTGSFTEEQNKVHKLHKKSFKNHKRYNMQLKGLTHEKINKNYLDYIIQQQRQSVEDYENIEMLHNTLQFNLLFNTYRDISYNTWKNYYKFKLVDFDQISNKDLDLSKNFLLSRFNLPHEYKEIKRHLQMEFRERIKKPLYYNLKLPNPNNPQFLTNVEIIKLPNANEIGWDNLKKYRDESNP